MSREIKTVGGLYKHTLNGKVYRVLAVVTDTDDNKEKVCYHEMDDGHIWVTDIEKWNARIDSDTYLFQEYTEEK